MLIILCLMFVAVTTPGDVYYSPEGNFQINGDQYELMPPV